MTTLNVTQEQKEDLFKFFTDDRTKLAVGSYRVFEKVSRNGAVCVEWYFVSNPLQRFPVKLTDFVSISPTKKQKG